MKFRAIFILLLQSSEIKREFIPALARAAAAVGIDGLFFETHPNPAQAKSDSATQLPLNQAASFVFSVVAIHEATQVSY